jgi:hypothetical protein
VSPLECSKFNRQRLRLNPSSRYAVSLSPSV